MATPNPGWSNRIFDTIRQWSAYLFDWMIDNIPWLRPLKLMRGIGFLTPQEEKQSVPIFDALYGIPDLPDEVRRSLDFWKWMVAKTEIPLDSLVALMGMNNILEGYLSPVAIKAAFHTSRKLATARPDPSTAWMMARRWPAMTGQLTDMLKDTGWSQELIEGFKRLTEQYLGTGELMALLWRGMIDQQAFRYRLGEMGYPAQEQSRLLELSKRIPGPGDLISMAVREAFHPDLVARYHYMDAFPPEFAEWMNKQGYETQWAEKYWVAHWRLPSIRSGFEMLHRRQIGMSEMRDLLRTADIAPFWHDPLINIAYTPYTRVDVRRMHKLGVLTDTDLVKSYRDLGYDQERAENMAVFTILYNAGADREGSKTDILKGYREGMFSAPDTLSMLIDIGYTENWAVYYISLEDLHVQSELADEQIKAIKARYIERYISASDARVLLSALNLSATRINSLMTLWEIARARNVARPSVGDLKTFYKQAIIDDTGFEQNLVARGYVIDHARWYKTSLLKEMQQEARDEEERAAKEQERIQAAAEKTQYQIDKTRIDLQIAQEKVKQLNLRLYMTQLMSSEERRSLMDIIETNRVQIAEIKVDIAGKRTRLQVARNALRVLEISATLQTLYDRRDNARIQISDRTAAIADLQVVLVDTRAALQRATVSGEVAALRTTIDSLTLEIAGYREIKAQLRLQIAETDAQIARTDADRETQRVALDQLDLEPAILNLYEVKDQTTWQVADMRVAIMELRATITRIDADIRAESVSPEILEQRGDIDVILVDIAEEQEEIAKIKLDMAQAQAQLVGELTSTQVAELEEELRKSQLAVRELEAERVRLRLEYVE